MIEGKATGGEDRKHDGRRGDTAPVVLPRTFLLPCTSGPCCWGVHGKSQQHGPLALARLDNTGPLVGVGREGTKVWLNETVPLHVSTTQLRCGCMRRSKVWLHDNLGVDA